MAATKLNKFLEEYTNWTSDWRITINTTKTQTTMIRKKQKRRRQLKAHTIVINGQVVTYTEHIKYLGITLTNKFHLVHHIYRIIKRVQPALQTLHYINREETQVAKNTRLKLYKTQIRSSITSAAPLLLSISNTNKRKLEKLHRKQSDHASYYPETRPMVYSPHSEEHLQ